MMVFDIHVPPVAAPTPLCELFAKHGSDKGTGRHNYGLYYDALLSPHRSAVRRVFELGVFQGASLRAWRDYFPHARIFGADIDPLSRVREDRIETFVCDETLGPDLDALFSQQPLTAAPFDVVLDDALHTPEANAFFLERCFEQILSPGGVWIIEDLLEPEAYWPLIARWRRELPIDDVRVMRLPPPHPETTDNALCVLRRRS
jgi:hypothetical protein